MMYTDSKLEIDTTSDSDWDEITSQPEIERSSVTDRSSLPKAKHKGQPTPTQELIEIEKPPATDPIERITKHKSNPETKQLGVSKTVPKLSNAVPTPPTLVKPRRGRRRQERSMDPPFEFSSLTAEESDTRTLSKAVSAPLKTNRCYQTDQAADRSRTLVTRRDSWDEVSELPEDVSQARLIEKRKRAAYVKDTSTQSQNPERTELQVVESVTQKKPISSMQYSSIESTRSDALNPETFTVQEPAKHQSLFQPQTRENQYIQTTSPQSHSPLKFPPKQYFPRGSPHENHPNPTKNVEGAYLFEEMKSDHIDYEQDLPEAFMMKLAQRSERKIRRFWQETFGCLRLFCSFFTLFFIECVRFCLSHVFQKLCIGLLLVCADHLWKPFLQCCYNGCLLPGCVVCANSCTSLVQVFKPILKCFTSILIEISKCCSQVRFCEVVYPNSHQDYATRFKTQVI